MLLARPSLEDFPMVLLIVNPTCGSAINNMRQFVNEKGEAPYLKSLPFSFRSREWVIGWREKGMF